MLCNNFKSIQIREWHSNALLKNIYTIPVGSIYLPVGDLYQHIGLKLATSHIYEGKDATVASLVLYPRKDATNLRYIS